jgi:hypothetical protein
LIVAAAVSQVSTVRLAITTVAPSETNSFAIALPMPVPPPDTKATLFAKRSLRKQLLQGWLDDIGVIGCQTPLVLQVPDGVSGKQTGDRPDYFFPKR